MVALPSLSDGLSRADIATLFGAGAASKPGDQTAAPAAASKPGSAIYGSTLIGGGSDAAKTIQSIVTQIQIEKMQINLGGRIATLDSASASTTFAGVVAATEEHRSVGFSTTVLDLATKATADNLTDAIGTLMGKIKAEEAQVEATQDGELMTKDDIAYAGHSSTTSMTWTSNSVTLDMKAAENQGVELNHQEGSLSGIEEVTAWAQSFESSDSLTTGTEAHGSALFLSIYRYHADFSPMHDKEQQIVSDFLKGALPGQDGKAAESGAGFSYDWENGDDAESAYAIQGAVISDYDPTLLAKKHPSSVNADTWMSADQKTAALGGNVIGSDNQNNLEDLYVIIPLDKKS